MGLASNYPLAMAPSMGLNAVVAFELVAGRGLTWPQAMTIVALEGVVIAVLVLTRFRQATLPRRPSSCTSRFRYSSACSFSHMGGPEMAPQRSDRPGKAVAVLFNRGGS